MSEKMRMHANRNLRPRVISSGERRGIPNYIAFVDDARPAWWSEIAIEYAGELLGVIENKPEAAKEAVILTSEEMIVLDETAPRRLRYDDIENVAKLEKEPVSEAIRMSRKSGGTFELPVRGRTGEIGDIMRFVLCAVREVNAMEPPTGADRD